MELTDAIRAQELDVQDSYQEALQRGETTPEELEHALAWLVRALEQRRLPLDSRLQVSQRLGETLVSSRLVWKLTGMLPCVGTWLEDDEFVTGALGDEQHSHLPPPWADEAQGEAYATLRRDGAARADAEAIARIL